MSNNQTSKNPVNGSNQTPDKLIRQFLNQPSVTTPVAYHPNNQFRPRNFYQNNRGPIRPSFSSNQVRPTTSFPKNHPKRVIYQVNQQPLGMNSTSTNVARHKLEPMPSMESRFQNMIKSVFRDVKRISMFLLTELVMKMFLTLSKIK